jgi:putative salt-induced outer membrane protein
MRQTRFEDGINEDRLALFLGSEFRYDVTDTLTLRQDLQAVFDKDNGSFSSTTSLSSNLYGRLSGKFSFTVDVETDPPPGNEKVDTYTRVSLVLEM